MNKQTRPVNLNLFTIKFPIPAIVSILHRLSGMIVFFLIPLMLWMFQKSLVSPAFFIDLQNQLATVWGKLILLVFLSALIFHLVAGIRHLLMDWGIGETLKGGRFSSWLTFGIAGLLILIVGIWLW